MKRVDENLIKPYAKMIYESQPTYYYEGEVPVGFISKEQSEVGAEFSIGYFLGENISSLSKASSAFKRTGEVAYKYNMIENPGPLAKISGNPASNFAGGKYNTIVLEDDIILYRAGKSGGGKNSLGQWFTEAPAKSAITGRIDTAVKPQWIDPKTGVLTGTSPLQSNYAVKIPAGTTIYKGPVGYQGGIYKGGQDMMQIFVEKPWLIEGVEALSETPLP